MMLRNAGHCSFLTISPEILKVVIWNLIQPTLSRLKVSDAKKTVQDNFFQGSPIPAVYPRG